MILPDVNLLIYAYDKRSEFHTAARIWLEDALSEDEVFLSWHTITGFLRIITHPSGSPNPLRIEDAVCVVDGWLNLDNVHLVALEKRTWPIFRSVMIEGQATGNLVMDAHLAAMSSACGATLATTDRDFARFSDIKISNPLQA